MTPPLQFGDLPSGTSLELAGAGATDAIDAAIELGNRARDTLGHLPFAAYEDAARNGGLLLGREGGNVVAYALFGATDRHVRLTHLCVEQRLRRGGIARLLINWISERHADRPGILVWCRRDYRLADMWSHLGFERLSERPGRGRGNRTLVAWWRDHGHPHLFTRAGETAIVRASVDLNIIRDLADESRPDRVESLALLSDQSADRLEVVRTPALDVEMDAMDDELRTPCVRRAHTLISIQPSRGHYASVHAEMLASANAADPIFVQSTQGELDIRYVSEAIAAGLNVFVTRDARLTSTLGPLAAAHGLRILRPAEVIVRMDELVRAEAYQPAALQATGFTRRLIGSGGELDLDAFVSRNTRERLPQLRSRVRSLTAAGLERVGIFSPEQKLVAAFVVQDDAGVLHVPLFRVADGPLADTIAHQLVFTLRMEALKRGDSLIRLVDPFMSRATLAAAADDGFLTHGDAHYAFVIDVCGSARDVEHAAVAAARAASLPSPAAIRHRLSGIGAGQVERVWWPAKVVDSELTSYLMPIRQSFSNELLGQPR
nr:GNAT family N-acetyltransferase [Acidobacteriota bacterium]